MPGVACIPDTSLASPFRLQRIEVFVNTFTRIRGGEIQEPNLKTNHSRSRFILRQLVKLQPRPDDAINPANNKQRQAFEPTMNRDQVHPVK